MRAIKTDQCDVTLTLPGGTADNDLPAERVRAYDPQLGEEPPDEPNALTTTWVMTEVERESVSAGAPVQLTVRGQTQPPLSLSIPIVPLERRAIHRDHATRAIGALYGLLREGGHLRDEAGVADDPIEPMDFLGLWQKALDATADPEAQAETNGAPGPIGAYDTLAAEAAEAEREAQEDEPDA